MRDNIEEIKHKIDIVDYVGRYVTLNKSGKNFKALCPFHQENSPSFIVSSDRQIWHCFGSCGEGGDVIAILMKREGLSFYEALVELAKEAHVELTDVSFDDIAWKKKENIYQINRMAVKFFNYLLHNTDYGKKTLAYLHERGLNDKIVQTFELGYAPASWDSLLKFLKKKGYSETEIHATGLTVRGKTGRLYDRFRTRLIFPIKDPRGNVVGFSGRSLEKEAISAKYINSPETDVYHKRESLYGISLAKDAIQKENNVYIVEGEFDMITPFQFGITNIVAIKGSALTPEQLRILKRYTNKITLALDADEAGIEAMKRGITEAEQMQFDIHIVTFSTGKDPDEAARKDIITFKKEILRDMPFYDYLINNIQSKYPPTSPFNKKKIGEELAPFINNIQNPIVKGHYIRVLTELLGVTERDIQRLLWQKAKEKKLRMPHIIKEEKTHDRSELIQKYILSYVFQKENTKEAIEALFSIMSPDDFSIPAIQLIAKKLSEQNQKKVFSIHNFVDSLPAEQQIVADELFLFATSQEMEDKSLAELVYELKHQSYKRKITEYSTEDSDESDKLVQEYTIKLRALSKKEIEKTLQSL